MREEVQWLRAKARSFAHRSAPAATRYSAEFRDEVVALAREHRALGVLIARVEAELGVRGRTPAGDAGS